MLLFSGYADTYDVTSDFGHRQDWTYCIWELLAFNGTESREESVGKSHILVFLGIHCIYLIAIWNQLSIRLPSNHFNLKIPLPQQKILPNQKHTNTSFVKLIFGLFGQN